jgi:hypothetical protein
MLKISADSGSIILKHGDNQGIGLNMNFASVRSCQRVPFDSKAAARQDSGIGARSELGLIWYANQGLLSEWHRVVDATMIILYCMNNFRYLFIILHEQL